MPTVAVVELVVVVADLLFDGSLRGTARKQLAAAVVAAVVPAIA